MDANLTLVDLAEILFVSGLQASEQPTASQIRAVVERRLSECGGDCAACLARVAQEAGDHPDAYVSRMAWALRTVEWAYGVRRAGSGA